MNDLVSYIPQKGAPVTMEMLERAEIQTAIEAEQITDIPILQDMRERWAAFEKYVHRNKMSGPALGAQRRLEARIGQLLGNGALGDNQYTEGSHVREPLNKDEIYRFRLLSHAFSDAPLKDEEWRQSQRKVLELIRERLPKEVKKGIKIGGQKMDIPEDMSVVDYVRNELSDTRKSEGHMRIRKIVELLDRNDLTEEDRSVVRSAVELLEETRRSAVPYEMIEPIANRIWGEGRHKTNKSEQRRIEAFEKAIGIISAAAYSSPKIEIPYLSAERASEVVEELTLAIQNLSKLRSRIKEFTQ